MERDSYALEESIIPYTIDPDNKRDSMPSPGFTGGTVYSTLCDFRINSVINNLRQEPLWAKEAKSIRKNWVWSWA